MQGWSVVVPVKRRRDAKTRLDGAVAAVRHGDLVLALALDTVAAVIRANAVRQVVVVTDDDVVAVRMRALGVHVVPDAPAAGLNPALRHGAAAAVHLSGNDGVMALTADLPALRPAELDAMLGVAAVHDSAVLADALGSGSTVLTARPGTALAPAFGPESLRAHVDSGARALTGAWPSLRRDVDTVADLREARVLGIGPRCAAVLAIDGTDHG